MFQKKKIDSCDGQRQPLPAPLRCAAAVGMMCVVKDAAALGRFPRALMPLSDTYRDALQRLKAAAPVTPSTSFARKSLPRIMRAVFLPEGYPASCSSDYMSYQLWDTAQAVCSSAVRVITTEALLKSLGVGDSSATALGATLQFVARDLLGKFARVFFCAFKGSEFDRNPKRWRLVADVTNDATACCDLLMPLAPPHARITLVCISSLCSAICGISGAATRSSLTQVCTGLGRGPR
jgi:hypothetical protein